MPDPGHPLPPAQAKAARAWRDAADEVYAGTFNASGADGTAMPPLPAIPSVLTEGAGASLDAFKHLVALVRCVVLLY